MGFFKKIFGALKKTKDALSQKISALFSRDKIGEEFYEDLTDVLISSDVSYSTADDIVEALRDKMIADRISEKEEVVEALKEVLCDKLDNAGELEIEYPAIITLIGVNGVGKTTTIGKLANYFKENGITPSLVLDEGGAVVEGVFPGVSKPCALVGIAEKGILNLRYEVQSEGGHASAPSPHTPVGRLARACAKVENSPFKRHITKPAADMFDTLGRHSVFVYRIIFANMWCFSPLLDAIAKKRGGEMNALLRTTVAFTQMSGSSAPNVIPPEASMVSNIRLNPEDTIESATEHIKKLIDDDKVKISVINGTNPSSISTTDCEGWRKLSHAIEDTWQGSIVSPYLMLQCSDSRHYGAISNKVYRFSAMALTAEERATIHGNNERIPLDTVAKTVEFYLRFIKQL